MKIYLNSDKTDDIKVEITGIDNNVEESGDIMFNTGAAVSTITGEMVDQIFEKASWEDKKKLALAIVDTTKTMVEMFYDAMIEEYGKTQQEIDIYGFMCDCFDMVMRSRKINEDEIIAKAKTVEPVLFVDENDGVYSLNIIFDDVCYTLGEVPVDLSEEDIDKESLKASFAAIVLFDKAFPDDESKNPVRRKNTFNIYHDMIKEKYGA